ncbi:MAG: hypothetical protein JWP69_1438 [Flaviaesturariibacter sp.]|nr:hypothetical protein [Flaviaesturariibacter sp.]
MKKLLLLLAVITTAFSSFAQSDPLREKLDSVFQHVNKSLIPTGYLKEYGAEFTPLHWFNGVLTDSNNVTGMDAFRLAYTDLSTAKIQAALPSMPALTTVNARIDSLRGGAAAPVVILYGAYASLRDDALSQNLMTIANQQVYDVAGRSSSPYLTNILFAAAAGRTRFRDTVRLTFTPTLYYTNTALMVTALWVDFKDGAGFRTIPAGGTVTKVYADSSGLKPVAYKAQLSNGAFLYCHGSVGVKVTPATAGNASGRYIGSDPKAAEKFVSVFSGEDWGDDKLQIRYSLSNPTRNSGAPHLRKPLIYVEGYDVEGDYDIMDLIRDDAINKKGEWVQLATEYDFMHDLDDVAGYDLVFVNYNTLRSFTQNTLMLQRVIEWVNSDKVAGGFGANKNVVLGVSAGGVLSRYTLARITKQQGAAATDARLLITMDSPHQGSNVPLGFQHFLYDIGECQVLGQKIKDQFEDLKKFYILNEAPATRELLKARVTDGDGTVSINSFLNGDNSPYQQMVRFSPSDNQPSYRFIATAQGSQCAVPVLPSDGVMLANYDGLFTHFRLNAIPWVVSSKWHLRTQINAIPASGMVQQIEYFHYTRRVALWGIGLGWKTMREKSHNNPVAFTGWDAAPGSTQSVTGRTNGALTTGLQNQLPLFVALFVPREILILNGGLNMNITQDLFSFVSTTSALDAPAGTPLNQPYVFPQTGNAATRTEKYIAQEPFTEGGVTLFNKNHTDFTARNAKWIYEEMEGGNSTQVACSSVCNIFMIVEDGQVCAGSKSYKLNYPAAGTVNWSVSPAGLAGLEISGLNNSTATLYFQQTGTVTLTATFRDGCNNLITQTKTITFTDERTTHTNDAVTLSDANPWCPGEVRTLSVNGTYPPFTRFDWSLSGAFAITSALPHGPSIQVQYNGGATANEAFSVAITSPCAFVTVEPRYFASFGDLVEGTITWPGTRPVPLQADNDVPENNATVSITVAGAAAGVQYELISGLPEVWGVFASHPNQMFVYNRAGGKFSFEASFANNSPCGPIPPLPFNINLSNARQDYTKVFRVYPNPLGPTTSIATVDINLAATASPLIQDCISAAQGRIRVEVLDFGGNPTGIVVTGAPGAAQVYVDMSSQPQGQTYLFVIRVLDCPSGIYQEVHQVIY